MQPIVSEFLDRKDSPSAGSHKGLSLMRANQAILWIHATLEYDLNLEVSLVDWNLSYVDEIPVGVEKYPG
jgi:hypothetical protein